MRALFFTFALLIASSLSMAWAQPVRFHAGIARISVSAVEPFDMFVWYPAHEEEVPWQAGPFSVPASRNAAIADGQFPILLLSHGGGRTGGSPLVLRGLAAYLARQGFIVVSPLHGKTRFPVRPFQIKAALEAMIADPRFKPHANADRLGMLGFSLGGAVTLELAGAVPDFKHLAAYCKTHPEDIQSCDAGPGGDKGAAPPKQAQSTEAEQPGRRKYTRPCGGASPSPAGSLRARRAFCTHGHLPDSFEAGSARGVPGRAGHRSCCCSGRNRGENRTILP